mmetsp:Transcript_108369/g.233478  ORF Transcript_108369/g.233478 Transcript_108369/m.233478 type:complete len:123 (+) Transcript_108369:73-441(+)
MTTDSAAERRKIRVAKVIEHRMKKQLLGSPSKSDSGSVSRRAAAGGHRPKGMDAQEIKRERRIRNRESAIRYRQRRQSELDECALKISDLQRENDMLRERLSKYENLNTLTERRTAIEPAIF